MSTQPTENTHTSVRRACVRACVRTYVLAAVLFCMRGAIQDHRLRVLKHVCALKINADGIYFVHDEVLKVQKYCCRWSQKSL